MAKVRRCHQKDHKERLKRQNSWQNPAQHDTRELKVLERALRGQIEEVQTFYPAPRLPILPLQQLR